MTKLMLVEDDNNLREIYGARLQAEGYEIVSAKDGEEALALAVKERPDLIISDVMMPKISGFDMLDILRSTTETKHTKVIMMTALSQKEDQERGEKLGADRYLVKSQVTLEDVVNVVAEVLTEASPAATPDPAPAPAPMPEPVAPAPAPAEPVAVPEPTPATPTPEPIAVPEPVAPAPAPAPMPEPVAPAPAPAEPVAPAAPPAPGGAVADPKTEAPTQAVTEPTTQLTTSPSREASTQANPEPLAQSPVETPAETSKPAPVEAPPDSSDTTSTTEKEPSEANASSEEGAISPAKRKGKVIKPISDPDSKPNINELLAKEESTQVGGVVAPAQEIAATEPSPPPEPPQDPPPIPNPETDISDTEAETVAEEKSEVNQQIQQFIDSQTEAVQTGDDTSNVQPSPDSDDSL